MRTSPVKPAAGDRLYLKRLQLGTVIFGTICIVPFLKSCSANVSLHVIEGWLPHLLGQRIMYNNDVLFPLVYKTAVAYRRS